MQNPFALICKSPAEVQEKLTAAFRQLFYGDADKERIRFGSKDLAYIVDIGHQDIRSEGMSYGMFITASLGLEEDFRALWNFSKRYLQNVEGDARPFFAWQVALPDASGNAQKLDSGAAPDGEEYFAAALLVAAKKFSCSEFHDEACELLKQMAHRKVSVKNRALFDPENFLVRFSPVPGNDFTDPSYHTLAFYRLFAKESGDEFWCKAYAASLEFLKRAAHPQTGLFPDYANFDGTPKYTDFFPTSECFSGDAWRVALNLAVDFCTDIPGICLGVRPAAKTFERETLRKWLRFFRSQNPMLADYQIDGSKFPKPPREITPGLIAMNAAATAALDFSLPEDIALAKPFLEAFWNTEIPTGTWRYYDGMLYLLGLLSLSDFRFLSDP